MSSRLKKALLALLAACFLAGASSVQNSLNRDRSALGLTRVEPLDNAPPVLAFTTVALGGFRGLISNLLWMRATELQDQDKFFEMAQLADWITKLEPHYVQVWVNQDWNMAYNISVKFTDYQDRWRWVQRGIELLRDEGLRYNPNEVLMYRELAWIFQHKMGANMDDAHMVYKQEWLRQMSAVFGKLKTPNLDELIHPQTDDQRTRARLLRDRFKMDPEFMKEVNKKYGPLEWRLPESHAVYWAAKGLQAAAQNPSKVKPDDLITLRRAIYQSMQLSVYRGRLVADPFTRQFEFGPNLDLVARTSLAYERAALEDQPNHDHILTAHRNFLRDAIYFLYEYNRRTEAAAWYKYLGEKYPNGTLISGRLDSLPANVSLDEYCISRIQEDIDGTPRDRLKVTIEGLFANAFHSLCIDEDEHGAGFTAIARRIWGTYMRKISADRAQALALPPLEDISREVLNRFLDPKEGLPPEARAILRTKLHLPADYVPIPVPAPATNAPPATTTKSE